MGITEGKERMIECHETRYKRQAKAYAEAERGETEHGFFIKVIYDEDGKPVALRKKVENVRDKK